MHTQAYLMNYVDVVLLHCLFSPYNKYKYRITQNQITRIYGFLSLHQRRNKKLLEAILNDVEIICWLHQKTCCLQTPMFFWMKYNTGLGDNKSFWFQHKPLVCCSKSHFVVAMKTRVECDKQCFATMTSMFTLVKFICLLQYTIVCVCVRLLRYSNIMCRSYKHVFVATTTCKHVARLQKAVFVAI